MKRIILTLACASALCGCVCVVAGCQTRITAEKYPEQLATLDGTNKVVLSGGWYVTARSPLWAKEQIKGLDVGANKSGDVWLKTDSYDRDLSTNAVSMTREIFVGSTNLVAAVAAAYAKISGGAQADTAASLAAKAVALFTSKGGDSSKATITSDADSVTVSDGTTSVVCKDGECTYTDEVVAKPRGNEPAVRLTAAARPASAWFCNFERAGGFQGIPNQAIRPFRSSPFRIGRTRSHLHRCGVVADRLDGDVAVVSDDQIGEPLVGEPDPGEFVECPRERRLGGDEPRTRPPAESPRQRFRPKHPHEFLRVLHSARDCALESEPAAAHVRDGCPAGDGNRGRACGLVAFDRDAHHGPLLIRSG